MKRIKKFRKFKIYLNAEEFVYLRKLLERKKQQAKNENLILIKSIIGKFEDTEIEWEEEEELPF